jgi:hypothetical protein
MPIDFQEDKIDFQPEGNTATIDFQPNIDFQAEQPKMSLGETFGKLATLPIEPLKHPENLMRPVPVSLGGKPPSQVIEKKFLTPSSQIDEKYKHSLKFWKDWGVAMMGQGADIATTPLTWIPLPIGKIVGKTPIGETTLEEIATKVPVGRGFWKKVIELATQKISTTSPEAETGILTIPKLDTTQPQVGLQQPLSEGKTIETGVNVPSPGSITQEQNPVKKITQALKEAKPIGGQQETLYSTERAKRVGAVVGIGKEIPGEAGYHAQLGALKGELPKVQFGGIRGKITQSDIDSLFNTIEQYPTLLPFEKITAKTGLAKLLGEQGWVVPTKGELDLLSNIFPQDFIKTVLDKRPLLSKAKEGVAEVLNIPRALMASTDMSAPLRQGAFLIGRPKQFLPALRDQFKYFFSEKAYQGLLKDIESRPTYPLMKETGLPLTDVGAGLAGREEAFMSQLAEKIPLIGKVVRASDRAYTGFLNKLRADVFDDLIKKATNLGLNVQGKIGDDIARFVGSATGRGNLGKLQEASVLLNSTFFSPRLMTSRLNLLNPLYYIKLDPFVRKEALKSLLTFTGVGITTLSLAKMGGAEIGVDPRSADFGKIKIGNTRYDPWGGFQQYIRLGAQLITGQHISSTTGVRSTVGEGYKPVNRLDILGRFFETKTAPVASFAIGLMRGQNAMGEKMDIPGEIAQRFIPMVIQDMADLVKERGIEGIVMGIPGIFGVGLQTYTPTGTEMVRSANAVKTQVKELRQQGRIGEAQQLWSKNKEIIRTGTMLEPFQKNLNRLENMKTDLEKNVKLTPEIRKERLNALDTNIKALKDKLEIKYKQIK